MNTLELTARTGRALLGFIATLAIGVAIASSAQAQSKDNPGYNKDSRNSDYVNAQKYRDAELNRYTDRSFPNGAPLGRSLEAKLKVTNQSGNEIRSVLWEVSFIDPTTGAVIGKREITSKSRIAPGKEKTLKKLVRIPHLVNFQAIHGRTWATLPTMTTALGSVTYADGTTSRTP
jgi:hypothetical protein